MSEISTTERNNQEQWEDVTGADHGETLKVKKGKPKTPKVPKTSPAETSTKQKLNMDLKQDQESMDLLQSLLEKANNKSYGKKIEARDLLSLGLKKISEEDIKALIENSMSKMDKIHLAHELFNKENKTNLSFDEFLFKQLNIQ